MRLDVALSVHGDLGKIRCAQHVRLAVSELLLVTDQD
jgi:hypothetical protein